MSVIYQSFANTNSQACGASDPIFSGNCLAESGLTQFPIAGATTDSPYLLYWSRLNGGGFFINFNDGNGWQVLSDGAGVYQTLTSTQKSNIRAAFAALGAARQFPASLYSVLVNNW